MANSELAKTPGQTAMMAVSDVMRDAGKGSEQITKDDVTVARLSIAQKTSPQLEERKDEYIAGLKLFQLFNNITGENYGNSVKGVVLTYMGRRAMLFAPFSEGGGVLERDIPLDDPRCQWNEDDDKPPEATIFDDYILFLPDTAEVVALSMKTFSLKTSRKLKTLIKTPVRYEGTLIPDPPSFLKVFEFGVATKEVNKNTVGYYLVKPAGVVDAGTYGIVRDLHSFYSKAKVKFEDDNHPDLPDEAKDAEVVNNGEEKEDIPF